MLTRTFGALLALPKHRSVLWLLTLQELKSRYQGSTLGFTWAVVTPLLMLSVYAVVFGQIFSARWPQSKSATGSEFAATLFAGLLVVGFVSDVAARAPSLLLAHQNLVKKMVFPLHLLPMVLVAASVVHLTIAVGLLVVFVAVALNTVSVTLLAFPVVLFPVVLFAMGAAWFLASLGVYFRDTAQVVAVLLTALIYLSPVFFPVSAVPAQWQFIYQWNPLTVPIEQVRDISVYGQWPQWLDILKSTAISFAFFLSGLWWFQTTSDGFADIL